MGVVDKTAKQIKALKIQGASNIRKMAVEALLYASRESKAKTEEEFRKEFLKNAKILFYARPTEPELRTAIRVLKRSISRQGQSVEDLKRKIIHAAENYEKNRKEALEHIANYGAEMIQPGSTILTLCHSSSAVNMLIKAKKRIEKVYCCETRPLYQGRITARELKKAGIDATLIVDNAASTVMKKCDYFITGADAFLADGDVINKIGTNQVSTVCKRYEVKHYVVTSTHKFEPESFFGKAEPIEERSPDEVWELKGKNGRGKVKIQNPAFDRTDSSMIEGIICELGIFSPTALASELYNKLKLERHHEEFLRL
ncbi:Ribose 1,5-bisphosphate isomerase [uncultured archaeon]|nr:Ribose 1,5-bisphosphate isomerase [uncultured archaeon]